jgi:hypothetical protein
LCIAPSPLLWGGQFTGNFSVLVKLIRKYIFFFNLTTSESFAISQHCQPFAQNKRGEAVNPTPNLSVCC